MLLLKQADRLSNGAYCWLIYSLLCTACPCLSPSLRSLMAPSKTVSNLQFKYLWKQLTEQCQGSSRWLMRGQDWASHTMEAQRAIWSRRCWTGGKAARDGKHSEGRGRSVQKQQGNETVLYETVKWENKSCQRCNKTYQGKRLFGHFITLRNIIRGILLTCKGH